MKGERSRKGMGDGMTSEQRLRELPKAIIKWYKIKKGSRAACIVSQQGNSRWIAEALEEQEIETKRIPLAAIDGKQPVEKEQGEDPGREILSGDGIDCREHCDFVIAVDVLEYAQNATEVLRCARSFLKPDGKLVLAADNRLGIRYFCGDQDAFTGKNYDSIENYRHLQPWEYKDMTGRAYSRAEIIRCLENAGFSRHRFFSVFPRISNPQILLAEDYKPNEALDIRVFPEYNNPDTVFLLEEELYPALMENGLLYSMANGFFIECPLESDFTSVNQVTLSGERGREHAMATILHREGVVEKRALYPEGERKLLQLLDNHQYLSEHGIRMIDMHLKEASLVMSYVSGIPATDYFRNLLQEDKGIFLSQMDVFWDTILHSSEQVQSKEDLGVILKRGYLDLVSLNCFYFNGEFLFYDQELYLENVPARAIMLRTIEFIYKFHDQLDGILPRNILLERYGIIKNRDLYERWIDHFLNELRGDRELLDYFQNGRREYDTVLKNRERLNYSKEEYDRIFKDIFRHIKGRKLYLFGSGTYAKRFRERYGEAYPITGYLDNDKTHWGTMIDGVAVSAPAILEEINQEDYKVMICIKDYMPVVRQLRQNRIFNFSVYEPETR